MPIADIRLEDRFEAGKDRLYPTGIQALVRVLLTQAWLDQSQGLKTGGFVSGSLGTLDRELMGVKSLFESLHIRHFR